MEGGIIMDTKQVVTNYHNAWTSGDMKAARASLANDLDFQGSIDTFRRKGEGQRNMTLTGMVSPEYVCR
jgi:ketosteroid isomerase-like protein